MRMPPLRADFIYNKVCELKCEKVLTRPLKIRKRGILAATEECLLSAMALNLKRMAKAIFSAINMDKIWAENMISQPIFHFCQ